MGKNKEIKPNKKDKAGKPANQSQSNDTYPVKNTNK